MQRRDVPTDVQAVVTAYAPMDFLQMDAQRDRALIAVDDPSAFVLPPGARTADARSYESLLIGAPIHDRPDLARAASPLTYVAAGAPPFLIVHGTERQGGARAAERDAARRARSCGNRRNAPPRRREGARLPRSRRDAEPIAHLLR